MKSPILIIYTGGTIGMHRQTPDGPLKPLDFAHIDRWVPEFGRLDVEPEVYAFDPPMDSSNMHPEIWGKIARLIAENYAQYDGFVVLHGSDSMTWSASALSFMLENLSKPVIFTGSQLPVGDLRTDARSNLITAIELASMKRADGRSRIPEVCIYFGNRLLRGNRTRKYHANSFAAFRSENYPELARAGVRLEINDSRILPPSDKELTLHDTFDIGVLSLRYFPGLDPGVISCLTSGPQVKALVIETLGAGNMSMEKPWIEALRSLVEKRIPVLNVTQCHGGSVLQGRYETSQLLKEAGIIGGQDMTFEAAVTKCMYLLGKKEKPDATAKLLQDSLRGELSI